MKVEDFFALPEGTQEEWVKAYRARQQILLRKASNAQASKELYEELIGIQTSCRHPLVHVKQTWDTDEYGKMFDTGYFHYDCPDCGKHWMEKF